jgi:hypothetical protein
MRDITKHGSDLMLEKVDPRMTLGKPKVQVALVLMLLILLVGCHAPQTSRHAQRGMPKLPKAPAFKDSLSGERRVLLDQLHEMAQKDALSARR